MTGAVYTPPNEKLIVRRVPAPAIVSAEVKIVDSRWIFLDYSPGILYLHGLEREGGSK